jgi:hypothetical protein
LKGIRKRKMPLQTLRRASARDNDGSAPLAALDLLDEQMNHRLGAA